MLDDTEEKDEEQSSATPNKNKKSFDTEERLSLRIDAIEANQYQAEKGKFKANDPSKGTKSKKKAKVRNPYDEEDEYGIDEDVVRSLNELQTNKSDASNGDTSLLSALEPSERRYLDQNTNIEISRHEQNAGKMNAILTADKFSKEAGLTPLSSAEFTEKMQEAVYNPKRLKQTAFAENVSNKMDIKGDIGNNKPKEIVKGVQKINEVTENRKTKNLDFDDVSKIAKRTTSKNATAELILEKSGQTARLEEIKSKGTLSKEKGENKDKSYSKKMKELLKESLRKSEKVR